MGPPWDVCLVHSAVIRRAALKTWVSKNLPLDEGDDLGCVWELSFTFNAGHKTLLAAWNNCYCDDDLLHVFPVGGIVSFVGNCFDDANMPLPATQVAAFDAQWKGNRDLDAFVKQFDAADVYKFPETAIVKLWHCGADPGL
jgi:hypothetical protein